MSVLFAVLDSPSLPEIVAVLLVTPAAALLATVKEIESVSVAPLPRFPIVQIPVPLLNEPVDGVEPANVQPVGRDVMRASVTETPVASPGPLLVAVNV